MFKGLKLGSLVKSTLSIFASQTLIVVIFFLLDILLARRLSVSDFASWKQLLLIYSLCLPLLSLGIPEGYKYFVAYKPDQSNVYLNNSILFSAVLAVLVTFLFIFFGDSLVSIIFNHNPFGSITPYFGVMLLAILLNRIARYYLINENNSIRLIPNSIFAFFISVLFYCIISFHWISKTYQLPTFFVFLVLFNGSLVFFLPAPQFKAMFKDWYLNFKLFMLRGIPLYLATFISVITLNLDKAVIAKLASKEQFAIYAVGAVEIPIFAMLSASVAQSIFPKMTNMMATGNKDKAIEIWLKATKSISLITYPMILLLMIFSDKLIYYSYGVKYMEALPLFRTFLLVSLWRNNYYGALFTSSGKTYWITMYSVISLVANVLFIYIIYPIAGMIGTAYATFIVTCIVNGGTLLHERIFMVYVKRVLLNPIIFINIVLIVSVYFYLLHK